MDIQKVFAGNVRKYRKTAGLSQEKLAELAGLHRTYIGGIEQRRVNVSLKNIGKVADALGVDPAALFLPDGDSPPITPKRRSSRFEPVAGAREPETAPRRESPPDYALCIWHDGRLTMQPIDVAYQDLTVQLLNDLIQRGHCGDDLAARYDDAHREILSFLDREP